MPTTVNISTAFINDTDTPATYVGQAGKTLQVNVTEDGLEFVTASGVNIYNANGTLTGNRTVTNSGFTLSFNGTTQVISPSASSLDKSLRIRNFGNTSDFLYLDGAGGFYLDNQIAINGSLSTGAMFYLKEKASIGGIGMFIADSTGAVQFQVAGQQVHVSNNKVRFLRSGQNYFDIMEDDLILRTDVSATPKVCVKFRKNGGLEIPTVQVGNAGVISGQVYFDTAANILANGDLIMGRKV